MVIWMDKWYTGLSLLELRTNLCEVWSFTITDKRRPSLMTFASMTECHFYKVEAFSLIVSLQRFVSSSIFYRAPHYWLPWLGEVTPVWQGNIGSNLSPDAGYTPHNTPLQPHSYIQFRQSSLRTPDLCSKGVSQARGCVTWEIEGPLWRQVTDI